MSSDAYLINKFKNQERGTPFTAFLILEAVIAIVAFFAAFLFWGGDLLELVDNISKLLAQSDATDPLVVIVDFIGFLLITIGVGVTIWFAYNVWATWKWLIWGYQTLLTVAVGLIMFVSIIQPNISLWDITIHWVILLLLAIAHLGALMFVAHTKFYPEYKGQSFDSLTRDLRVIRVITQIIFAFIFFFVLKLLWINIYATLEAKNALPTFDFLFRRAGFQINQSPDWYSSNSRYGDAFVVGVINTLQIVSIGLVAATIMGVLLGIFLLSGNWLVRSISRVYVEILRNTPLLVQLIFWYFVLWLGLPAGSLAFPEPSVMVIPLRVVPILLAFIGISYYAWRYDAPPRLINGIFAGIIVLEFAFRLLGDSYPIIIYLALMGLVLIDLSARRGAIRSDWVGFVRGIGIMAIVQFVGHILLDILGKVGIIENSRAIYGEVQPLLFLGPNVFGLPRLIPTVNFWTFILVIVAGIAFAVYLYYYLGNMVERTGADIPRTFYAVLIVISFIIGGWFYATQPVSPDYEVTFGEDGEQQTLPLSQIVDEGLLEESELLPFQVEEPLAIQLPSLNRFGTRVQEGLAISPSFMALLIGLVVYTSAFIGEIVRAGIQAVPHGQVEAARALGLSTSETLRMIVLPQALRVIIPPMGNQYLNLSKNSSLATAIAFSDTYQIGQTVMNQSGQSITGFFIVLLVYLTLSLIISLFMNYVNSRFQLVTR